MVQVAEVMAAVEEFAPVALAEPWDNVGLMFGGRGWPVAHVLLALDATPAVVAQAEGLGDAMVVTHHPLFFEPLRALVEDEFAFRVVQALAQGGIALYAAHTNLDKSPTHGTPRALAEALGFGAGADGVRGETILGGLGSVVNAAQPGNRQDLATLVAQQLGSRVVQLVGEGRGSARRIALVPGSGGDALASARAAGAQVMVTGELKHHEALEAELLGPAVITAGHFETEQPVLALLQRALQERLPGLDIRIAEESSPIWSVHSGGLGGSP